jgi:hypothetical protein
VEANLDVEFQFGDAMLPLHEQLDMEAAMFLALMRQPGTTTSPQPKASLQPDPSFLLLPTSSTAPFGSSYPMGLNALVSLVPTHNAPSCSSGIHKELGISKHFSNFIHQKILNRKQILTRDMNQLKVRS